MVLPMILSKISKTLKNHMVPPMILSKITKNLMKKHASADHPPASVIAGAVYQIGFWQKQLQELVR